MENISPLCSIMEFEGKDIGPQVHFVADLQKALLFVGTTRQLRPFAKSCGTPIAVECGRLFCTWPQEKKRLDGVDEQQVHLEMDGNIHLRSDVFSLRLSYTAKRRNIVHKGVPVVVDTVGESP